MSITPIYYVERRDHGAWCVDHRNLPRRGPDRTLRDMPARGFACPLEGFWEVYPQVRKLSAAWFPEDLSAEVRAEVARDVVHAHEELLAPPREFGWVSVAAILAFGRSDAAKAAGWDDASIQQWLDDLEQLGDPEAHRIIYWWW